MRTVKLRSIQEVHGVLEAGWDFLQAASDLPDGGWQHIEDGDAERIVNDLVAKSIRNWMLWEQWSNATVDA